MDGQKRPKSTFPKERLYQLQKNYRERKKAAAKKNESELEEARALIQEQQEALAAARLEILQLKAQLTNFRIDFEITKNELVETKAALKLVRQFRGIEPP